MKLSQLSIMYGASVEAVVDAAVAATVADGLAVWGHRGGDDGAEMFR